MKEILEYKKKQMKTDGKPWLILCAKILQAVLMWIAFTPFIYATEGDNFTWAMLIATGETSDIIAFFRSQIWCVIIAFVIRILMSKFMIEDEEK